ncbi:MAG: hypothetical protein E7363_01080 [Clostridiales bacterium]|nr:hypothetical protein [Clostridiales bacterium]
MTVYQMLEKLLKSDLITLLLGGIAFVLTAVVKRYVPNKKARTFLPFLLGLGIAFIYGLFTQTAITLLTPKRAISVGTCATVFHVFYKRFFSKEALPTTQSALTSAAADLIKDVVEGKEETTAVKDAVLSLTERLEESVIISEKHEFSITEKEERE